jgi:hypothetical protein
MMSRPVASAEQITGQAAQRVQGWRMWVAPTTIMLSTLLSYIDRQLLAVLSPMILQETGLTGQS